MIRKGLLSTSRWGNHFLIITFFGLSSISCSYFNSTLWGNWPRVSKNTFWILSCIVDIKTVEPNVNKMTPCGESSMNSNISLNNKMQSITVTNVMTVYIVTFRLFYLFNVISFTSEYVIKGLYKQHLFRKNLAYLNYTLILYCGQRSRRTAHARHAQTQYMDICFIQFRIVGI